MSSWLWSGIEGSNPTPNNLRPFVSADEIRQLRELHRRRPLMISDDDVSVIDAGHRQLLHHHQTIDFIKMPKIVKRSVQPDILNITGI